MTKAELLQIIDNELAYMRTVEQDDSDRGYVEGLTFVRGHVRKLDVQ